MEITVTFSRIVSFCVRWTTILGLVKPVKAVTKRLAKLPLLAGAMTTEASPRLFRHRAFPPEESALPSN